MNMVYNSGQHVYVGVLFSFFFVPQDLIDKTYSFFQKNVF